MNGRIGARTILVAPLVVSGLLVSGCMSSPTYGTGTTQTKQLTTDVSSMLSLKPKRAFASNYTPRPELVKPGAPTTDLPPPQESIVTASAGEWPESPEQRRARIRAEATENRDKQGWEPEVVNDIAIGAPPSPKRLGGSARGQDSGIAKAGEAEDLSKKGAAFREKLDESKQGSPTVRRTLTEPPLEYRQPAATAAADELGEDEYKKQRRLKAEARKANGDSSWRDLVPWL
ncbi:MAG TPA: hypothetical protein VIZ90_15945 [Rhizobiaceae bacterium]